MRCVGTGRTARSQDDRVRTADMEPVEPISMKALVALPGRSSTVPDASNVRVISLASPLIPVSEYFIIDLNTKGPSLGFKGL